MDKSIHASRKLKLHIYPFNGKWILVNDFDNTSNQGSFECPNEALNCARSVFKDMADAEVVIHSKYDSMPHFRVAA